MQAESGALAGKVAIVSGGSGAIGTAILDAFDQIGVRAISLDLSGPSENHRWVKCDVREDNSVAAAVDSVYKTEGRIDLVVHAAGISRDSVLWKMTLEDWDSVQAVNLRGAFLLIRHSLPLLRRGSSGRIVLIGSINGSRGKFGTSAYSASKAGLIGLTKSLAREVGRFGILVNVVEPGWVRSPLTEVVPQAVRDAALAESVLGSFLEPADVAASVVFLCGSGANHITGQILRVDGGQYLGGT
ncbi:MAG: SDR family NAD(P)-dependent oxidoreductase [Candidatus Acidiferrales bacterium]